LDEDSDEEGSDDESGTSSAEESALGGDDDEDVDAPRISQWVDDDDDDLDPTSNRSDEDAPEQNKGAGPSQLVKPIPHIYDIRDLIFFPISPEIS
jgi:hypothetical protein